MLGRIAVTVIVAVALGAAAAISSLDPTAEPLDAAARARPAATPPSGAVPVTAPARTITYDVRGLDNRTDLEQFATEAAVAYADPRGWSLGGSVRLARVPAGGDFTLWLSAANRVPRFGDPCDSTYSCQQGRNVIINEDRWVFGSPAWNGAGASVRDYRHMVMNHETGHWLGFKHAECPSPGAPAAVMQQQSISMQGCAPSAWPSAAERQWAAAALGVDDGLGLPVGTLDAVTPARRAVRIRGWALDPDTLGPTIVLVRLDGTGSGHAAARLRPDVAAAHGAGPAHGFAMTLAAPPGPHRVCIDALNVAGGGRAVTLGCRAVKVAGARPGSRRPS